MEPSLARRVGTDRRPSPPESVGEPRQVHGQDVDLSAFGLSWPRRDEALGGGPSPKSGVCRQPVTAKTK